MSETRTTPPIGEIKALTGLRGLAALWVVAYHVHLHDAVPMPLNHALRHGYLAVDVFFALSGFVMALSYARFFTGGWSKRGYGIFLWRRFARIWPLHAAIACMVTLSVAWGFSTAIPRGELAASFTHSITLTQIWGRETMLNFPSWSISTEAMAYLLFPLLTALMLARARWLRVISLLACIGLIGVLCVLPSPPEYPQRAGPMDVYWAGTIWPLLRCLAGFALGMAAWRASTVPQLHRRFARAWPGNALAGLFLLLLFIPGSDFLLLMLVPPMLLALAVGEGYAARLVSARVPFFLGEVSYAVYLLHAQFLRLRYLLTPRLAPHLGAPLADALACVALYGSLILAAWLAYRCWERPARSWLRKFEPKLPVAGGAAA